MMCLAWRPKQSCYSDDKKWFEDPKSSSWLLWLAVGLSAMAVLKKGK